MNVDSCGGSSSRWLLLTSSCSHRVSLGLKLPLRTPLPLPSIPPPSPSSSPSPSLHPPPPPHSYLLLLHFIPSSFSSSALSVSLASVFLFFHLWVCAVAPWIPADQTLEPFTLIAFFIVTSQSCCTKNIYVCIDIFIYIPMPRGLWERKKEWFSSAPWIWIRNVSVGNPGDDAVEFT